MTFRRFCALRANILLPVTWELPPESTEPMPFAPGLQGYFPVRFTKARTDRFLSLASAGQILLLIIACSKVFNSSSSLPPCIFFPGFRFHNLLR